MSLSKMERLPIYDVKHIDYRPILGYIQQRMDISIVSKCPDIKHPITVYEILLLTIDYYNREITDYDLQMYIRRERSYYYINEDNDLCNIFDDEIEYIVIDLWEQLNLLIEPENANANYIRLGIDNDYIYVMYNIGFHYVPKTMFNKHT